jgi:hypothetical protein
VALGHLGFFLFDKIYNLCVGIDLENMLQRSLGESTLRVSHFCSKKVMYNKYYSKE